MVYSLVRYMFRFVRMIQQSSITNVVRWLTNDQSNFVRHSHEDCCLLPVVSAAITLPESDTFLLSHYRQQLMRLLCG